MELYEYLIGGKKTGQIDDLKDTMSESKPFRELKEGDTFFVSLFEVNGGTRAYAYEIKITSIRKKPTYWEFSGLAGNGVRYAYPVEMKDLNKTLFVEDLRTRYKVCSTFKMDDKPCFELVKKEIKNSKNK